MEKQKVVFILGPTGVGKTNLSVKLAKVLNGQIISADSVQVYKGFDIGSAKVTTDEMQGIKHYGIDIKEPNEEFSVFDYVNFTKERIAEIARAGHLPIIVGGTGLYVKALTENYNFGDASKNDAIRQKIEDEITLNGQEAVYNKLVSIRPDLAQKLDKNNKPRLVRAMEIALSGGKQTSRESEYDFKIFALNLDREKLYERINLRAEIMLKNGLVKEVKSLYERYGMVQGMRAIGYKEIVSCLDGQISEEEALNLVKQHSRNYAKRQLTFLRTMKNVEFVDAENQEEAFNKMYEEIKSWIVLK